MVFTSYFTDLMWLSNMILLNLVQVFYFRPSEELIPYPGRIVLWQSHILIPAMELLVHVRGKITLLIYSPISLWYFLSSHQYFCNSKG